MSMSFETALTIVAEVAGDVPEDGSTRSNFLARMNWREYEEAVMVLVESGRELPGPMVIFLPGQCGRPLIGDRYQRIKRSSMGLCDCGNVRLLSGGTLNVPEHCPIFIRRRRRKGEGVPLLRFDVSDGILDVLAYPFDNGRKARITAPIVHLFAAGHRMIGVSVPDAAILTLQSHDPENGMTRIELNAIYEVFEPPYDPAEVPKMRRLN